MNWWIKVVATFLLVVGTNLFFQKPSVIPHKPIEIPKEATSTAVVSPLMETATVKRVVDGDTIELTDGSKLRYIGINAPEFIKCFGNESTLENKKLVEGKDIRLEKDISQTDKYGRLLRYVYVGDIFINDYLVREGFAHAATFPPDVRYADQFRRAEQEARENNRGLWNGCKNPTPQ